MGGLVVDRMKRSLSGHVIDHLLRLICAGMEAFRSELTSIKNQCPRASMNYLVRPKTLSVLPVARLASPLNEPRVCFVQEDVCA